MQLLSASGFFADTKSILTLTVLLGWTATYFKVYAVSPVNNIALVKPMPPMLQAIVTQSVTKALAAPTATTVPATAIVPSTSMTTEQESTSSGSSEIRTSSTTSTFNTEQGSSATIYSGESSTQAKLSEESGSSSTIHEDISTTLEVTARTFSKENIRATSTQEGSLTSKLNSGATPTTETKGISTGSTNDQRLKTTVETSSRENAYITSIKRLDSYATHISETSKDGHTSGSLSTSSSNDISAKSIVHFATSVNPQEGISATGTQMKDIAFTMKSLTTIKSDPLMSSARPSNAVMIPSSQSLEETPKTEANPTFVGTASTSATGTTPSNGQSLTVGEQSSIKLDEDFLATSWKDQYRPAATANVSIIAATALACARSCMSRPGCLQFAILKNALPLFHVNCSLYDQQSSLYWDYQWTTYSSKVLNE